MSKRAAWSCDFENPDTEDGGEAEMGKRPSGKSRFMDADLDFEDPFEDDYEEEEQVQETYDDSEQTDEVMGNAGKQMGNEEEKELEELDAPEVLVMKDIIEEEEKVVLPKQKVWRPGVDPIQPDEQLEFDNSAYTMLHRLNVEWPCLSIDLLRDNLGEFRTKYPATLYMVAGSQADNAPKNKISVMKLSDLRRTSNDEEEDDDDDNDETEDDPIIEERSFAHFGGVNRIRSCPQMPHFVSTFAETSKVAIWDISTYLKALDAPPQKSLLKSPEVISISHPEEGFALDWSPCSSGLMASGDCKKNIFLWQPNSDTWVVDKKNFKGHTASVEDIQFSPNEPHMLISCSVDQSIRVWDCRTPQTSVLSVQHAHDCDINVVSWNRFLLV